MRTTWCPVCCTTHSDGRACPGELAAHDRERHAWRVNVETPNGIEAYGVLLVKADCGTWRARVMTYPNVLWAIPGGTGTIKFAGSSPLAAERAAIDFVREHCHKKGFAIRNEVALSIPQRPLGERTERSAPKPAPRLIRFLPIRFGVVNASEIGGTGNLSETGLFVITNHPVTIHTKLRMRLDLDQNPMDLSGEVRWMNSSPHVGRSPGMGVRLHTPPKQYADYVRTLSL